MWPSLFVTGEILHKSEGLRMTGWNMAYDYVAFFIMFVIAAWYTIEKRIPLQSYFAYTVLLHTSLLITFFEIAATNITRLSGNHDGIVMILMTLNIFFINLLPAMLVNYSFCLASVKDETARKVTTLLKVEATLISILVVSNYFTHVFFVVENGVFIIKTPYYILYGSALVLVIIALVNMIRWTQTISLQKTITIAVNLILVVIAAIVQARIWVPFTNAFLATFLLTLCHYLHNPDTVKDQTTMLFNRKMLGEYVARLFLEKKQFGIINIAMDDFKFVNKTYGVAVGDELLLSVGSYLDSIDNVKYVFRFGSDQFCIVVDAKKMQYTDYITDAILERFKHPWYDSNGVCVMMSASVCCFSCPQDAENYASLVDVMDYSMAVAKKSRKGIVSKVGDLDLEQLKQEKDVEKEVRLAMDRDELMVYYQPIYSVEKGRYNSAEALVRLHSENLGWISPEVFIPISEKNGLIVRMGETILEKVCMFIRDFELAKTSIEYIEVNISSLQLMQVDFVDRVKDILQKYDVKPCQINMEITETASIGNMNLINKNIAELIEFGINFSLDDYGSGNANIDYINHMPFKIIKLDKYIIWDAFKDIKAGVTLKHTIKMLNELDLKIVAEGVETEEMKDKLAEIGCHFMQGWYYSKAVCDSEFKELIEIGA